MCPPVTCLHTFGLGDRFYKCRPFSRACQRLLVLSLMNAHKVVYKFFSECVLSNISSSSQTDENGIKNYKTIHVDSLLKYFSAGCVALKVLVLTLALTFQIMRSTTSSWSFQTGTVKKGKAGSLFRDCLVI